VEFKPCNPICGTVVDEIVTPIASMQSALQIWMKEYPGVADPMPVNRSKDHIQQICPAPWEEFSQSGCRGGGYGGEFAQ